MSVGNVDHLSVFGLEGVGSLVGVKDSGNYPILKWLPMCKKPTINLKTEILLKLLSTVSHYFNNFCFIFL